MNDKKTLITIIVLLVIVFPLGIIGTVKNFTVPSTKVVDDNLNKEFIYNNKLYFYLNDKLVSTYACNNCSLAEYKIDDNNYHTNYYNAGVKKVSGTLNNYFGLFKKGDNILLYNLVGSKVVDEYNSIKDYRVNSSNNFLITKKDTGFGVTFIDLAHKTIPNNYDYIAVPSHLVNGVLDATNFIVKKDNLWLLLNEDGTINKEFTTEIVDYSNNYYILYDGLYHIVDSNDTEYLTALEKTNVYGVDKYIFVLSNNQLFVYEDLNNVPVLGKVLPSYQNIYFNKVDNGIEINIDGKIYETLELS